MENKFNIGDFVIHNSVKDKSISRGQIINIIDCKNHVLIEILGDGFEIIDFDYKFELDREKMRDKKLKELGI